MYYHFHFRIKIEETSTSVMLESKQHLQWTSLQYLQVPVHDCTCSDFVANSYTVWWVPFSVWPLQSIPIIRPGVLAEIILSLLRLERKQNNSSNPFPICIVPCLSYSFEIETTNTFIHSCSSLENHTRWGGTYLYSLYKGVPHPHPSRGRLQKAWTNQLMKRPVDMTTSIALSIKINY